MIARSLSSVLPQIGIQCAERFNFSSGHEAEAGMLLALGSRCCLGKADSLGELGSPARTKPALRKKREMAVPPPAFFELARFTLMTPNFRPAAITHFIKLAKGTFGATIRARRTITGTSRSIRKIRRTITVTRKCAQAISLITGSSIFGIIPIRRSPALAARYFFIFGAESIGRPPVAPRWPSRTS